MHLIKRHFENINILHLSENNKCRRCSIKLISLASNSKKNECVVVSFIDTLDTKFKHEYAVKINLSSRALKEGAHNHFMETRQ